MVTAGVPKGRERSRKRTMEVVLSLAVALSLTGAALIYLPGYVGQQRIYVQERWISSSDSASYQDSGYLVHTVSDTAGVAGNDGT